MPERIAALGDGRLLQYGTPHEVYEATASRVNGILQGAEICLMAPRRQGFTTLDPEDG
jgi:hypothetical protein